MNLVGNDIYAKNHMQQSVCEYAGSDTWKNRQPLNERKSYGVSNYLKL